MGDRITFRVHPCFQPGEQVLVSKPWLWFSSAKSLPAYRVLVSLPPLWEAGMYVTDRRILLVAHVLRLVALESSTGLVDGGDPIENERVREVRTARHWLWGPYLEIISENGRKHWYRSRLLRLRVYSKDSESLAKTILGAMKP